MPKAVVSTSSEKFELTTLEGAFVELKRMTYGQKLDRIQMATDMQISMSQNRGQQANSAKIDVMQKAVTLFDFKNCIVDHNLFEDDDETIKFDFTKPSCIDKLDPRVGEEIATLIDSLNNFEPDLGK